MNPVFSMNIENGYLLQLNWVLCADINAALHNGNLAGAQSNLQLLVRLAKNHMNSPFVSEQYLRMKAVRAAVDSTWAALQAPGWTDEKLCELQTAWQGCELESDYLKAMEMNRAMWIEHYKRMRYSDQEFINCCQYMDGWRYAMPPWALLHLNLPLWRFAWSDLEESAMLDYSANDIAQGRWMLTNSWTNNPPSRSGVFRLKIGMEHKGDMSFLNKLRFLSVYPQQFQAVSWCYAVRIEQIRIEMAKTAIALERYKLHEKKYPKSLEALVPEYLPAKPRDRADGGVLRYKSFNGEFYQLYSVGRNCIDDGGDVAYDEQEQYLYMRGGGKDIVWPQPTEYEKLPDSVRSVKKRHRR